MPPDIQQFFIPVRGRQGDAENLIYQPMLVGAAKIRFMDAKSKSDVSQAGVYTTAIIDSAVPVNWDDGEPAGFALEDLGKSPARGAQFASLPAEAGRSKNYAAWGREFANWLYGGQKLDLLRSPSTGQFAHAGESERDFRVRLQQAFREQRDDALETLRKKYAPKIAAAQEKVRRAEDAVDREAAQAKTSGMQTAISFGSTVLGALLGGGRSRFDQRRYPRSGGHGCQGCGPLHAAAR